MELLARHAAERSKELLRTFRLVAVGGARQSGKTTLVRDLLGLTDTAMVSFDDPATLARAAEDPVGFLDSLPRPAAVDEFQRAGEGFLLAVKQAADRDRSRGQLLLTCSTSYLASSSLAETLAGRVGRLTLWPLSAGERRGTRETFATTLFKDGFGPRGTGAVGRDELVAEILRGGFPEVVTEMPDDRSRRDWFAGYFLDVVAREALRPLADVRLESELRRVLRLLAARNGQELVVSSLAADAGLARTTAADYVALLEALHLVVRIPAWATSATTRAKHRSKVLLVDSGLAAHLTGASTSSFAATADGRDAGALFECFVAGEICKQVSWSGTGLEVSHFRDRNGAEVDLVVFDPARGLIAGIEVRLTATPLARHARHLAMLRDRLGRQFHIGIVLHAGTQTLPLGERLWALPVDALWAAS